MRINDGPRTKNNAHQISPVTDNPDILIARRNEKKIIFFEKIRYYNEGNNER